MTDYSKDYSIERLDDLIKSIKSVLDITEEGIAKRLGYNEGYISQNRSRGKVPTKFLENIRREFKDELQKANFPARSFLEQRREQKNSDEPYLVPYVDIPAQAGYRKAYNQRDYIATLKKYPILPDVDPTGAIWRYFQIEGDSMEPEFKGGDIILCSQVNIEDWQDIKNYHTHVIVTETDLWIKDVYRENKSEWILLSQNESEDPFPIKVQDIRQVWVMRRHVKARANKSRMYDMNEIKKRLKRQTP